MPRDDAARATRYVCSCGHDLSEHDMPSGDREPYGACNVRSCPCREAWVVEDPE